MITCSCHSENLLSFLVALSSIINSITMTSDLILCAAHKSKNCYIFAVHNILEDSIKQPKKRKNQSQDRLMLSLGHCETDTHNHTHTVKFQLILFSGPVKLLASNYSGHQQRPLLWGKAHTWARTHSHVCAHTQHYN